VDLVAGPLAGQQVSLHDSDDTLTFIICGRAGRYVNGQWVEIDTRTFAPSDEPAGRQGQR